MLQKNIILYVAIGDQYIDQAIFSILTIINVYQGKISDFKILIYTDRPNAFLPLSESVLIETVLVSHEQVNDWSGRNAQILRIKIKALKNVVDHQNVNLLYVDTDTLFLKTVDEIFEKIEKGYCVLHSMEWSLRRGRKLHPEFCPQDLDFRLNSGCHVKINDESLMWNSGVVGISSTLKQVFSDVLDFNDRFYEISPSWHVEQFAFSVVFHNIGRLIEGKKQIFHYWHNKDAVDPYLIGLPLLESGNIPEHVRKARVKKFVIVFIILYNAKKWQIKKILTNLPGFYKLFLLLKKIYQQSIRFTLSGRRYNFEFL